MKDFFGQTISLGDTVACLGTQYKELYLYQVEKITEKRVKLFALSKIPMSESRETYRLPSQCIVHPKCVVDKSFGV